MRFRLLGTLEVAADDGSAIDIPAAKRRVLLAALLLAANRQVSIEQLQEALWGPEPPRAARQSLQAHVSRLRAEIGPDRILTIAQGYLLRVGAEELDIDAFERRVADGRRAIAAGRWQDAALDLRAAIAMWRGPALVDFSGLPLAEPAIARLESLRQTAIVCRLEAELAMGHQTDLVPELQSLIARDPLHEELWRHLILALYRSGRQAEALAAYQQLRRELASELGLDPHPHLQELHLRILRQDPSLLADDVTSASAQPALPPHQNPFVGRSTELATALEILSHDRLLTLTGPGGVGKTRLALAIADALTPIHPDGVWFVDLAPVTSPSEVLLQVGHVIGGGGRVADVIGGRRALLVVDNFEHLPGATVDVARLLDACPNLRVVVTSRTPLRMRGETLLDVPGLPPKDAASLFVIRSHAALGAQLDAGVVHDTVARLDGLPLAIELAAAGVRGLAPEAARDLLRSRLDLQAQGSSDALARHRTLRDTIGWSYELLSPPLRAAFRKLSALTSDFSPAAALAVGEMDVDELAELVDHSLVGTSDGRYRMLETIREFAADEAAANAETRGARDRHLAFFAPGPLATRRAGVNTIGRPAAWLEACRRDRDNLQLAFEWAAETSEAKAIVDLFLGMGMYWLLVGDIETGRRWGDVALKAVAGRDANVRMRVLMINAELARHGGDFEAALTLLNGGLAILRELAQLRGVANALDDIAWTYAALDDYERAWKCLDEARSIHRGEVDCPPNHLAHTLATSVEIRLREGRIVEAERALAAFDQTTKLNDDQPDRAAQAFLLRGQVQAAAGRFDESVANLRAAIRIAARMEFRAFMADALDGLAAASGPEDAEGAARLLGMADRLRAEANGIVWLAGARAALVAAIRARLGDAKYAAEHAEGHALGLDAIASRVANGESPAGSQGSWEGSRTPGSIAR